MNDKKTCECHEKTTIRSENERKKLIHRLNRIEGQIRGIRGMVGKRCILYRYINAVGRCERCR